MAASRSPTLAKPAANGSALVEYRVAALGIVEPSNSAMPAAPTGAIPDRIPRYLSRNDILITLTRPAGSYSKGRLRWSNGGTLLAEALLTLLQPNQSYAEKRGATRG